MEQRGLRAQGQVQELALVLEPESFLEGGLQQVLLDYFQHTEACPGWSFPSVQSKEEQ